MFSEFQGSTDHNTFAVRLSAKPEHLGTSRFKLAQWLRDIQMPRIGSTTFCWQSAKRPQIPSNTEV